jgi:hypothetical protein
LFGQYAATYATAALNGSTPENAHIARNVADTGRLIPGTRFQSAFNKVTNEASVLTGSKLVDNLEYTIQTLITILRPYKICRNSSGTLDNIS